MLWAPKRRVCGAAVCAMCRRLDCLRVSEEHDYRTEYNEAVRRAIAGDVGFYRDFDRHRQETVWRLLSSDRQALLRFCQRQGISVGRMETMQTLKSPKPLLQLIAHGHDADTVARWARRA